MKRGHITKAVRNDCVSMINSIGYCTMPDVRAKLPDINQLTIKAIFKAFDTKGVICRDGKITSVYSGKKKCFKYVLGKAKKTRKRMPPDDIINIINNLPVKFTNQDIVDYPTFTGCRNRAVYNTRNLTKSGYLKAVGRKGKAVLYTIKKNSPPAKPIKTLIDEGRFNPEETLNENSAAEYRYMSSSMYLRGADFIGLCGPEIDKKLKRIIKYVNPCANNKVVLIDNNMFAFDKMRECEALPANVRLVLCNIKDTRFNYHWQDMDFMKTFNGLDEDGLTCGDILKQRLSEQKKLKGYKTFMFTLSVRGVLKKDIIKDINRLLVIIGSKITGFDGVKNGYGTNNAQLSAKKGRKVYLHKHRPDFSVHSKIVDFSFFTYADKSSMIAASIVYL